ncbi:MAG: DUF2586 family protein [Actinomycetota bacterium]|nr:DUF2586 family protein [Actinomycetota bacterium]
MPTPAVTIFKSDGNTGVVRPAADGILAIIATCEKGPFNLPASYARPDLALADYGNGALTEANAYCTGISQNSSVLIRGTGSLAGTYGTVAHAGAGTSVVTASVGAPLDDFAVVVTIVDPGTVGTAGATYTYSLDGGKTVSGKIALGTATTIVIPGSGVTLSLAAGTLLAGQTESVTTTGPNLNNADVVAALEALRLSAQPWDALLIDADADATMVAIVDTWLLAREAEGRYKTAIMNTVMRTAVQSEAVYATAMAPVAAGMVSKSIVVGADGADLPSQIRGIVQKRQTSWFVAARGMRVDMSTDVAFVGDGPVNGASLYDDRGNPKYHDELASPGLDTLRLATLRTFFGRDGVYINNAPIVSSTGSDYVFWQHARLMNKGCGIVYDLLTGLLSLKVRKQAGTGLIFEEDAASIEAIVNTELTRQLVTNGRVTAAQFVLSRTDNLTANAGATLNGELQMIANSYVKKFAVQSRFVRTITAKAS